MLSWGSSPETAALPPEGVQSALERERSLRVLFRPLGRVLVAYSGGVDSTYLCLIAREVLGADGVLAVTADSETYPEEELGQARAAAEQIGFAHRIIRTHELMDERFAANPPDRCYFCKQELFAQLTLLAEREARGAVLDGSNADDERDHRPGRRAAEESGVRSPLAEVGMGKSEVRHHLRRRGLALWDRPAAACLASRFPYGTAITGEALRRLEAAEAYLRGRGFRQVRVRVQEESARIEVDEGEIARLASPAERRAAAEKLQELGYTYVALDLEGYRTGSMNRVLQDDHLRSGAPAAGAEPAPDATDPRKVRQ